MLLKSRVWKKFLLVAVLLPLLFFPVFYVLVLVADTLVGDRLIVHHYLYVSRRELLDVFLSDWYNSLFMSYAVTLGFLIIVSVIRAVPLSPLLRGFVFLLCCVGGVGGISIFYGFSYPVLFLCVTGITLAIAYSTLLKLTSLKRLFAMRINFIVIFLLLLTKPVVAKDYVWIIGGGSNPSNSQVSIEKNVSWIQGILDRLSGDREVTLFYTDGNDQGNDVVQETERHESKEELQPLARIFGKHIVNKEIYRNNTLQKIQFGTEKEKLVEVLKGEFAQLTADDRALIIFNGHGLPADKQEEGNTIRVWGDETISVRKVEKLLAIIPRDVPVRFVFPQCFSGGFFRLVNTDAQEKLNLDDSVRCGFFAVSENKESEG